MVRALAYFNSILISNKNAVRFNNEHATNIMRIIAKSTQFTKKHMLSKTSEELENTDSTIILSLDQLRHYKYAIEKFMIVPRRTTLSKEVPVPLVALGQKTARASSVIDEKCAIARNSEESNDSTVGNAAASLDKVTEYFVETISSSIKMVSKSLIISHHGGDIEKTKQLIALIDEQKDQNLMMILMCLLAKGLRDFKF